MKRDLPRLSESSSSPLVRQLLRSAGPDAAPSRSRQRALVAAGLAASTVVVSTGTAASVLSTTAATLALKWLGTGFLVGCVSLGTMEAGKRALVKSPELPRSGTVQQAGSRSRPPSQKAPSERALPAESSSVALADQPVPATEAAAAFAMEPARPGAVPSPRSATLAEAPTSGVAAPAEVGMAVPSRAFPVAAATTPATAAAGERPSSRQDTFALELGLVDGARKAASTGQPAQALALLDKLEREHGGGSFGPEATAIRVEVLLQAGQRTAAERLAQRFTAQHPNHPLARRVRALIAAQPSR